MARATSRPAAPYISPEKDQSSLFANSQSWLHCPSEGPYPPLPIRVFGCLGDFLERNFKFHEKQTISGSREVPSAFSSFEMNLNPAVEDYEACFGSQSSGLRGLSQHR